MRFSNVLILIYSNIFLLNSNFAFNSDIITIACILFHRCTGIHDEHRRERRRGGQLHAVGPTSPSDRLFQLQHVTRRTLWNALRKQYFARECFVHSFICYIHFTNIWFKTINAFKNGMQCWGIAALIRFDSVFFLMFHPICWKALLVPG